MDIEKEIIDCKHKERIQRQIKNGDDHISVDSSAPVVLGSNPKHTIYALRVKLRITKINKKTPDWPIFLKEKRIIIRKKGEWETDHTKTTKK